MRWPGWLRWLLWPLAFSYATFMRLRARVYRRGWLQALPLPVRVVSIGNLTVGGTGKTPMVLHLAQRLRQRGLRPAILTRGYGRTEQAPLVANGMGETSKYTPELMGDEPILFTRRVPELTVGIGADRFTVAAQILAIERESPPHLFLLDDGFQHLRLARDVDVVLLDATDPFGGRAVLPAGRLREPLSALGRADVIVLTRPCGGNHGELISTLKRYNTRAPIFRASTRLAGVQEAATDRSANLFVLKQQPVLAFCGLGNPQGFWNDVERWGFNVVERMAFGDHHRYGVDDFRTLMRAANRSGARALLTTEKDAINLRVVPPSSPPTLYCRIELELDDEEGFLDAITARLETGTH